MQNTCLIIPKHRKSMEILSDCHAFLSFVLLFQDTSLFEDVHNIGLFINHALLATKFSFRIDALS